MNQNFTECSVLALLQSSPEIVENIFNMKCIKIVLVGDSQVGISYYTLTTISLFFISRKQYRCFFKTIGLLLIFQSLPVTKNVYILLV